MKRSSRKKAYRLCALLLSLLLFLQNMPYAVAAETEKTAHTLYAGPTEHAAALAEFSDGDTVAVLDHICGEWSLVRLADGTIGCCDRTLLGIQPADDSQTAEILKTAYSVPVLSSPDASSAVIAVLPKNVTLTKISELDGFFMIQLKTGRLGYVPVQSAEAVSEQKAIVRTVPKLTADTGITTEAEAAARLQELSSYFQNGRYWNCLGTGCAQSADNLFSITDNPCAHPAHGYRYCNIYTSTMSRSMGYSQGMQCLGYAGLLSDLTFGTDAPVTMHSDFEKLRVGDHIRLVLWDHSMLITEVCKDENGRTYVYVTEVNADYDNCRIEWGRKFTQQDLRRLGDYVHIYTRYPPEDSQPTTETED